MERLELKKILSEYYSDDSSLELAIQKLKDAGASQMECTKTLVLELKIPLSKADEIIVKSKAWQKNFDAVNTFRDKFLKVISTS